MICLEFLSLLIAGQPLLAPYGSQLLTEFFADRLLLFCFPKYILHINGERSKDELGQKRRDLVVLFLFLTLKLYFISFAIEDL